MVPWLGGYALADALRRAEAEPYAAKRELAARVVGLYHGEDAARAAAERFDLIHRQHGVPEDVTVVYTDDRAVSDIRDQTKASIERGIDFLLDEQRFDPNRSVLKRLLGAERRR